MSEQLKTTADHLPRPLRPPDWGGGEEQHLPRKAAGQMLKGSLILKPHSSRYQMLEGSLILIPQSLLTISNTQRILDPQTALLTISNTQRILDPHTSLLTISSDSSAFKIDLQQVSKPRSYASSKLYDWLKNAHTLLIWNLLDWKCGILHKIVSVSEP